MPLDRPTKDALIRAVSDAAQVEIMPRFRALAPGDVDEKSGVTDLVTVADTAAEAHIRAAVANILPGARVIGEEGVAANPAELDALATPGLTVVIDPIDGTWNYARGLATFGTLLAVVEDGQTIFGLLYDPVVGDWIEATRGEGAWHVAHGVRRRLTLGPPPPLKDATLLHARFGLTEAEWRACAPVHMAFAKLAGTGASLWDYRTLTTGGALCCMNRYLKPWDHAAGALALTEAGGYVALLDGTRYASTLREGLLLAAGSRDAWEETRALFAPILLSDSSVQT